MLEDIVIRLEDNFSEYLTDIRENEDKRIENELIRIENEKLRNEYFARLLEDKKSYYKRFRRVYKTISENENTFGLPDEYTDLCMLDVYVNGFCLTGNEYCVVDKNVVLTNLLDVVGSVVELVVTKAIGITEEDYDDLRGYSAYEVAVKNGFEGSEEDWLRSLSGDGGYKRMVKCYVTTVKNERMFELPYQYDCDCDLDVYVNGFKLNGQEYVVEEENGVFSVVLTNSLDVIGTCVELVVIDANTVNVAMIDRELDENSENPLQNKVVKRALDGKLDVDTFLFSGDYNDLENKPEIPSTEGLATTEYVNGLVGNIDALLSNIADESEAI